MLDVVAAVVLVAALALGPLAWRMWRDRREQAALEIRAGIAAAVRNALHGDSLIAVDVEAPGPLRNGRVILAVPGGWEWLIQDVWPRVVARVPRDYELVVRAGRRPASAAPERIDSLPRAA
jgi:hypothetical protein